MLFSVGIDLPEMVVYFRPDDIAFWRENSEGLQFETKEKRNAELYRNYRNEKLDVLYVSIYWQVSKNWLIQWQPSIKRKENRNNSK